MVSNNYNNYNNQMNNISYGAVKDVVPANINEKLPPNLQNLDAKQIANNNGAISAASGADSKSLLATIPFYLGLVGLRTINDNPKSKFALAGSYEKSIFGKLAKLGDGISGIIKKIIPDSIETKIKNGIKGTKTWITDHSAIARSMQTPLKLENSMAISEASGMFSRIMYDNADLIEKGCKELDLTKYFNSKKTPELFKLLQAKDFDKATGADAAKIAGDTLRDIAKTGKTKESVKCAKEIAKVFDNVDEKAIIKKWGKFPIGKIPILGKLLTLKAPLSEVSNKTRVAIGATGTGAVAVAKSGLGKFFVNGFTKTYEATTSNIAGGKIAPVLEAFFLAQALMRAKDAPKGQKLATFMDEEVAGVTTLFAMPIATSIMTAIGGWKYIGLNGKDAIKNGINNVNVYRDMVENLNARVKEGRITRGEYVDEVKKIKDFLNVKNVKNGMEKVKWWQKPFKVFGKMFGSGYKGETIRPYIDDAIPKDAGNLKRLGLQLSNQVKKLSYKFKTSNFNFGAIARFAAVMFVISPIISKPIRWITNKIFGKPYDPEKEKEEAAKKAQEEAMKNNPFANMTEQQLIDLLSKNKDTMLQIQNNPELMQQLQTNPQMLYDMLQQGAKQKDEALKTAGPSPMLQNYLNQKNANPQYANPQQVQPQGINNTMNQNMGFDSNATMPKPSVQANDNGSTPINNTKEVSRSYIPSSKPNDFSKSQAADDAQFNSMLAEIDKTEKEYSKYLGL